MKRCIRCDASFSGAWTCPRCRFAPATIQGFPAFAPELA